METVTLTTDQLSTLITGSIFKAFDMVRYANRGPQERITRDEMIHLLNDSRKTYDKAVRLGLLKVQKDEVNGQFSPVYTTNIEFKRFLKTHYPEQYNKYYTIKL